MAADKFSNGNCGETKMKGKKSENVGWEKGRQNSTVERDTEEEKKMNHLLWGLKTIIMLNNEHQKCVQALSCIKYIELDAFHLVIPSLQVCFMWK